MGSLRNLSINRKLTLIIMAASTVALLLVSAGFVAFERVTFRQSMIRDLATLGEIIGRQSTAALTFDDQAAAQEILGALTARRHIVAAGLYKGKHLFARYPEGRKAAALVPARAGAPGVSFENDRLVLFHPFRMVGEPFGMVFLQSDLGELDERMGRYASMIVLFVLASWLMTYLVSTWLQRIISRPILHLAETAKMVSAGKNYSVRARKHGEDELGQLIESFNQMLTQIQERDAALQQANDQLEKRVQERTQDLGRAYEELRQTQQTVMQQERLKALGQMASGIAHDVNNALSPVVGFADLLVRTERGLSPSAIKYLQHIQTSGQDIAHIVARLREFYRRRDEREALFPLHLNRIADQVIDMMRPLWRDIPQRSGVVVELETQFDAGLPELAGIESEVREALTNLILNAVDAIPNGGKIIVRTRVLGWAFKGEGERSPTHAVLEVSDSGVGMDEQTRKRCLDPFFSTKGKRGTGLGLAMVYGVVQRHEGTIEIESAPGQGTTVRLIFPIREALPGDTAEPGPDAARTPLRILCIDDEPLLRELLHDTLAGDGHRVQIADGGQAGVDAFRAAHRRGPPFDVVVTDLGMPHLDGCQVAKAVKAESPGTPVILLTGWGSFMKADGDLPAEVDAVLSKPPQAKELREALNRLAPTPAVKTLTT
jgi:signal transduction histidine kinase/ActR/RegA family two-component response regulator